MGSCSSTSTTVVTAQQPVEVNRFWRFLCATFSVRHEHVLCADEQTVQEAPKQFKSGFVRLICHEWLDPSGIAEKLNQTMRAARFAAEALEEKEREDKRTAA